MKKDENQMQDQGSENSAIESEHANDVFVMADIIRHRRENEELRVKLRAAEEALREIEKTGLLVPEPYHREEMVSIASAYFSPPTATKPE